MQKIIKLNVNKELPVMGIKIMEDEYVDDFVNKGVIHFSYPQTWRDASLCSGEQLDEDEGCFCYSKENNDRQYTLMGRKFKKIRLKNGWKYYEDNNLIVGTCFYGIMKSEFKESRMQYGIKSIKTKDLIVPKDYFGEFCKGVGKTQKVVIVFDFKRLINAIVEEAIKIGASSDEIYISPVYYVNKKIYYCTTEMYPFEYFLKDDDYSKQAEIRVIIASKNKKFYQRLSKNNNNISIGDISSFATIQENYTENLSFSIQGDKLIYSLSRPITLTLDERSFAEIVQELYQIKQNQLPGEAKEQRELDALAKPLIEYLNKKYGVEYRDDWRLYKVPENLYNTLPELYKGMCILAN